MSNRAYLCCSPWRLTHPSGHPQFDPARHTVATAIARVPLLWMIAFRPNDKLVCPTRRALAQLAAAADELGFASDAKLLAHAIESIGAAYLAIELDEIDDLYERGIAATLRRALALDRRALYTIAEYDARKPERVALLGASHIRDVGWETPPKRRTPKPHLGRALRDALTERDVDAARALLADGADPNFSDSFGSCWAVCPIAMLDELITAGGDIDKRQRGLDAPIIRATWAGDAKLVGALLDRGADPHVLDTFKRPALAIAAHTANLAIMKQLLAARPTTADLETAQRTLAKVVAGKRSPRHARAKTLLDAAALPARANRAGHK